jgi:uncharacterized protein with FMN-binding domain
MKKYFQITFFLGIFGLLVIFRHFKADDTTVVASNVGQAFPTTTLTPTPSQAPSTGPTNTTPTVIPTSIPTPTSVGLYKNGTYTGSVQDAFYGYVQVQAVISSGKISDVLFLQYPNDNRTSQFINNQALPMLKQEAISAQSATVNMISGASATSPAFQASLADALAQAKK